MRHMINDASKSKLNLISIFSNTLMISLLDLFSRRKFSQLHLLSHEIRKIAKLCVFSFSSLWSLNFNWFATAKLQMKFEQFSKQISKTSSCFVNVIHLNNWSRSISLWEVDSWSKGPKKLVRFSTSHAYTTNIGITSQHSHSINFMSNA